MVSSGAPTLTVVAITGSYNAGFEPCSFSLTTAG